MPYISGSQQSPLAYSGSLLCLFRTMEYISFSLFLIAHSLNMIWFDNLFNLLSNNTFLLILFNGYSLPRAIGLGLVDVSSGTIVLYNRVAVHRWKDLLSCNPHLPNFAKHSSSVLEKINLGLKVGLLEIWALLLNLMGELPKLLKVGKHCQRSWIKLQIYNFC